VAADGIFLAIPEEPGPGIRLAVKDLLDTARLRTTYGSAVFADYVPATSAESVRLAETGGYANVGKTNLHEFAYGITSENQHFGTVPNPLAPGRIAGGSSGGSAAALAASLADAALGTDSGGSIRIPAACCGVVGFKPTYELVSAVGCFPLAPSFDHVGPMARTVEDCVALLEAIAPGFTTAELGSVEEIEVATAWTDEADPLVVQRVREAAGQFPRSHSLEWPRPAIGALFMREVADVHRDL
jgi:Asp-tRNA(Asn)/Glu-tRNA(Gln) amidotransferase A subunit family amidase